MTAAKVIRITGSSIAEITEITSLLQNFMNVTEIDDVRKLLLAVKEKPTIVKTALRFV
jgi:hypothetical protein